MTPNLGDHAVPAERDRGGGGGGGRGVVWTTLPRNVQPSHMSRLYSTRLLDEEFTAVSSAIASKMSLYTLGSSAFSTSGL